MKKAILDLTECKYLYEVHQRIQEALDFPDYYGKNLDALWDCLNRDCDVNFVTIIGIEKVAKDLKPTIKSIIDIFEENKKHWFNSENSFDYEIVN